MHEVVREKTGHNMTRLYTVIPTPINVIPTKVGIQMTCRTTDETVSEGVGLTTLSIPKWSYLDSRLLGNDGWLDHLPAQEMRPS